MKPTWAIHASRAADPGRGADQDLARVPLLCGTGSSAATDQRMVGIGPRLDRSAMLIVPSSSISSQAELEIHV